MEDHRFVDFTAQIALILAQHAVEGGLCLLRQIAGLQDATVTTHLELCLLLPTDHRPQEG